MSAKLEQIFIDTYGIASWLRALANEELFEPIPATDAAGNHGLLHLSTPAENETHGQSLLRRLTRLDPGQPGEEPFSLLDDLIRVGKLTQQALRAYEFQILLAAQKAGTPSQFNPSAVFFVLNELQALFQATCDFKRLQDWGVPDAAGRMEAAKERLMSIDWRVWDRAFDLERRTASAIPVAPTPAPSAVAETPEAEISAEAAAAMPAPGEPAPGEPAPGEPAPGEPAAEPECPVKLGGEGKPVFVRGQSLEPLSAGDYAVIEVLVTAYPERVGTNDMKRKSHDENFAKKLSRLRKQPQWAGVLAMPGGPWKGYGLKS